MMCQKHFPQNFSLHDYQFMTQLNLVFVFIENISSCLTLRGKFLLFLSTPLKRKLLQCFFKACLKIVKITNKNLQNASSYALKFECDRIISRFQLESPKLFRVNKIKKK